MRFTECAFKILVVLVVVWMVPPSLASNDALIRVGVLKYGTLNWEMDVIDKLGVAERAGIDVQVVSLGSPQALLVALQSDAVDLIIGDWIWVARQQERGKQFYFFPYSNAASALVVTNGVSKVSQLRGKKLGVAGGKANKNWTLYSAYLQRNYGIDLDTDLDIKFAAPPMLNALMMAGKLDAVINFWHYSTELNNEGLNTLVSMPQLMRGLGIESDPPMLGWIFAKHWADANPGRVDDFLQVSYNARQVMIESDDVWRDLPSMQHVETHSLRTGLIDAYRAGVPAVFGKREKKALRRLFDVIKEAGDPELVGSLQQLPENIFWASSVLR